MSRIDLHQTAIEMVEGIEKAQRRLQGDKKSLIFYKELWFTDMVIFYTKRIESYARLIERLESRYAKHLKKMGI